MSMHRVPGLGPGEYYFCEFGLVEVGAGAAVIELRGRVTWRTRRKKGVVELGQRLRPDTSLDVPADGWVLLRSEHGDERLEAHDEKIETSFALIVSLSAETADPEDQKAFERAEMLGAVDEKLGLATWQQLAPPCEAQDLIRQFEANAIAMLTSEERGELRVVPIKRIDERTVLVASDGWSSDKTREVSALTGRHVKPVHVSAIQFEELLRAADLTTG